jgi:PAS domain S-box-containing protein
VRIQALRGYGLALAAVGAALLLRWLFEPRLQGEYPFSAIYAAIAIAVWIGGFGPGVLAAAAGYLGTNYLFIPPFHTLDLVRAADVFGLAFYGVSCAIIILLGERMRRARQRVAVSNRSLADREARLELTLRSISDAFYILDRDWRYIYINPQAERYFGRPARTMYGRTIWENRPQLAGTIVEREYRRAMAEQVAVHFTYRSTMTDRWIEVRAYPSRDSLSVFFLDIHERKLAEEAAQVAESRLREVTDALPALISYIDRDGRYRFNNRAYEEWFGIPRAKVRNAHVSEVLGQGAWDKVRPKLEAALGGEKVTYEMQVPYLEGGRRWISANYVPHFGTEGKVEGVFALVTDISQRKALEDELRQSEELLRLAERAANAGSWSYDVASGAKRWSAQCHALYGTDPASFTPTLDAWAALVIDRDRAAALASVKRALTGIGDFDVEFRIRHPQLGERWLWETGRAEFEAGRAVRMTGITMDITQRKVAERSLRQSEMHFRSMADTVPSMLWVTDRAGNSTYLSKQWSEFTGRRPEEDLGWGWLENVHPQDRDSARERFRRAAVDQQPFTLDYRLRRRDGEYRWMVDTGAPKYSDAGLYEGHVGCVIDVDERKRLEQALKEADRRKDEFLAVLGHELRNPLAPMRNSLGVLQLAGDDAERRRISTQIMDRQVSNLTRLVDDLLDVGRIVSGKVELRRQRTDATDFVRQGVETALPGLEGMEHRITTMLPTEPVFVDADPVRMTQVVSNLLNNAAKFTNRGGRIEISLESTDGIARITVKDNGVGIPPDKLDKVFDMFVQVDSSPERRQGGLGLGLTLVKKIIEMHGGRVEARSAGTGHGSEFIVSLPLAQGEGQRLAARAAPQPAERPRRFFIVDDNQDSAESLAMLLRMLGHDAGTAHSGEQALKVLPEFRPDIVVCDISMPDMSGFELAERLRSERSTSSMILVALTGFGGDEDRQRTAEAGFDAHFVKPVDPQALAAVQPRQPQRA